MEDCMYIYQLGDRVTIIKDSSKPSGRVVSTTALFNGKFSFSVKLKKEVVMECQIEDLMLTDEYEQLK